MFKRGWLVERYGRRTLWRLSVVLCLLMAGCSTASHRSLNRVGQPVELRDHLVAGKTNVFYFYADW